MAGLRCRDDAFSLREEYTCCERVKLLDVNSFHQAVLHKLRHYGTGSVIAQATCVDVRRNEVMAEREHRNQRCQAALVPKIILEFAVAELRTACRLCSDESCLFPIEEIVSHKRK